MNKAQAIHSFWSSFGWKAYDQFTVPPNAEKPYITYNVSEAEIDNYVGLYGSLWDRSTSWEKVELKAEEIAQYIVRMNPIKIDGGYLALHLGSPFSQRLQDEDDTIRRIYINLQAEFLTEF